MAAIAAWLGHAFAGLGLFVTQWMAKKAIMMGVYVALYLSLTATFAAVINGSFTNVAGMTPPGGLFRAGFEMMPSAAGNCIAALATAHLASVAYSFALKLMDIKQKA